MKLYDSDLSMRTINILKSEGIETREQLLHFSQVDLLKLPNFGRNSLREVTQFLGSEWQHAPTNTVRDSLRLRYLQDARVSVRWVLSVDGESFAEVETESSRFRRKTLHEAIDALMANEA